MDLNISTSVSIFRRRLKYFDNLYKFDFDFSVSTSALVFPLPLKHFDFDFYNLDFD